MDECGTKCHLQQIIEFEEDGALLGYQVGIECDGMLGLSGSYGLWLGHTDPTSNI